MVTAAAGRTFGNFINGEWVAAKNGATYLNHNPANTDEVIGEFPLSGAADVDAAVAAARDAYKTWRLVPAPKRAEILFRAAELLVKRKEEYARDMTREMGKFMVETRGDVQRHDYAVEFSDGDPVVEDDAGAGMWEYRGAEAC